VAAHAKQVVADLPALATRNDMIVSKGGMVVGELFSQTRDKLADMLIDSERSYRGTLLGMRHGVDVLRLLHDFAEAVGKQDLRQFCEAWLAVRVPLVQQVDEQLRWFAQNPDEAVKIARPLMARARGRARTQSERAAE
jgi:putative NIF3 family GTP cyclohydrolase 1 type 2